MLELRTIWGHATALAWVALRSFAGTLALFAVGGLAMGAVSCYCLKANTLYACIFAAAAIAEGVALGIFLGSKRALAMALAHGVARAKVGSAVLQLCFERLLQVSASEPFGARGTEVAVVVERLPLAQAERYLSKVIDDLMRSPLSGNRLTGWFWRLLHRRMLRLVQTATLTEFRQAEAEEGGVDLVKVQTELGPVIDDLLIKRLKRGLNLWMLGAFLALLVVVAAQIYIALEKVL